MKAYSTCPHCRKPIYDKEALLCLYCGGSLGRTGGAMSLFHSRWEKLIAALICLVTLLGFLIVYMM